MLIFYDYDSLSIIETRFLKKKKANSRNVITFNFAFLEKLP